MKKKFKTTIGKAACSLPIVSLDFFKGRFDLIVVFKMTLATLVEIMTPIPNGIKAD